MDSPEEAAKRILTLVPTGANDSWGISRCDGTTEELARYRTGSYEVGWDVKSDCRAGDLLVGSVGHGSGRVIVNVNKVEGVGPRGVEWVDATDVPILPAIGWHEVGVRYGQTRPWTRLVGPSAIKFIRSIADELRTMKDVPPSEGDERHRRCRERSTTNRIKMLDLADGVCEGCGRDFRAGFGARGDRALEVHHLRPMSKTPGQIRTTLSGLAVLCASCHRLVHADPHLRIDALRAGWTRM